MDGETEIVTTERPLHIRAFRIKALLFDFDGTLTHPGSLDLPGFARSIGCPAGRPVLEWIESLPDAHERRHCARLLEGFELRAAAESHPNPGAEEVVRELRALGLKLGILSRNGRAAIDRSLLNFPSLTAADFDLIITRDTPLPPKPAPDGILHAANSLRVRVEEVMLVGDYVLDLRASRQAGSIGVLLLNDSGRPPWSDEADYVITSLAELPALARRGLPLPAGKLPQALLAEFLDALPFDDASLVMGPGVGQDVACVRLDGATAIDSFAISHPSPDLRPELLALKTDPITFATTDPARYAVRVNINDLVTCGADPRWFLASVLFPPDTTPSQADYLLSDLAASVAQEGLTLCGGHTEITDAVTRPVIVGFAAGVLQRSDLRDKRSLEPGDRILLTKRVAVEGTALLAAEAHSLLRERGMSDSELASCRRLLDHLSVVPEARLALAFPGVRAMHDVTEGGLATAVTEFSIASGHGIQVEFERIPFYPQTLRVCSLLGLNPLGLIGSGSMLIACGAEDAAAVLRTLSSAQIECTEIGLVQDSPPRVTATRAGIGEPWPEFEVDEVARFSLPSAE